MSPNFAPHLTLAQSETTPQEAVDNLTGLWENETTQAWLVDKPIRVAIILLIALVGHWLLRRLITKLADNSIKNGRLKSQIRPRRKAAKQETALSKSHEARRVSRLQTLASVGRSAAGIFIWVWAVLAILDEVGVNVAPLVASAGVVGVALGFGAQSLVKDFLSGIFMLLEDQYGIGDTIDLGNGVFGDVESISLRITTVRDIDGALWYVRNGEILQVANHSDHYSVARVQVPVALSNDPDKAFDVISKTVEEAALDDAIRDDLLDKPDVNGISSLEVDHMSFRVVVKTLPGKQWGVQRKLQSKILNAMHANDIDTPYPQGVAFFDMDEAPDAQVESLSPSTPGNES
ncbi:mechanosensitive ion channel protein MscS [Corynebacterium sp. HMSC08C04]|uniref:Mechanosensitive ion channel family protein n=1 Tax=Corynebacterium simulans TaxID=146827 RepID=A0ABR5V7Q7_9CORY|nr:MULTISPECIES: mechanosensitive ion channel family protein [Corynebacterium]AMO92254.1 mechanosensitive ion channel family protein [Corynebacterium simulans]KXU17583.1 mechanosensitive ion channel family protein [Corynebacterium simulans]OFM02358.1 mechanosensitive ion channel protein MscS [Corynebacterium sp. HMSC071F07]OFR36910.1 mechanosensitive ion channel protein MscS [Corynebacterium sp. HMSC077D03]OFT34673.1 mechanosensitive ion channel protein MscS [Corynebacterium sp. HMSC08C04]